LLLGREAGGGQRGELHLLQGQDGRRHN
jgi:hypothetical protein